ncbi:MAG TPA: nicotinate-nucleotide adenylyltransferase [Azospirillaceae bacterium]|nr:nicotinate-nucleotide adenylyltransferase [Azospirillaceae bacterium]
MTPTRIPPRLRAGHAWAGLTVGLLGGSFNPAHEGHRHASLEAMRRLGLDQVWWLVSPQNPLKPALGMAPQAERLASARAMARHPRIRVTDIEADLGTRYTVETLAELQRRFPRTRFVWLMGADNLAQIPRWRGWIKIFGMVPVAVMPRRPYSIKSLLGKAAERFAVCRVPSSEARGLAHRAPPAWTFLDGPVHPASATEIRRGGGRGRSGTPANQR